jgi:SAM-dependent methyltransferase
MRLRWSRAVSILQAESWAAAHRVRQVVVVDLSVAEQRLPERQHVGGHEGVQRDVDELDGSGVGWNAQRPGGGRYPPSQRDVAAGQRHGDAGAAQVYVQIVLLVVAGKPTDLIDERDARRQRAGRIIGRDQVVEATPILDTFSRVETPGGDLHRHAREPDIDDGANELMPFGSRMAAGYDRGRGLRSRDVERWMAAAGPYLPSAGGRILDLGAGTGRFSEALARFCGASVCACEPSAAMRAVLHANLPDALVVGGAAEASPFLAGVFDAVWASQVVHHVKDLPAFAADLRHVLRPHGHLLIRGGFGPVQELPLYKYFPLAWAAGSAARLSLERIAGVLAEAGFAMVDHVWVEQTFAETSGELVEKVEARVLSPLAGLPDQVFERGLSALRSDADNGRLAEPIVERLDLVVFRAPDGASAGE